MISSKAPVNPIHWPYDVERDPTHLSNAPRRRMIKAQLRPHSGRCPMCGGARCAIDGVILHPTDARVAGIPVDLGNSTFHLTSCNDCGFQFKTPSISEDTLLRCYIEAEQTNWRETPDSYQRQFDVLAETLSRADPGNVILDVGCFNGAFLQYLGPRWHRFGVEPSTKAAELAAHRGATIVGRTIADVPRDLQVDALTAIDVVEHIIDPPTFFAEAHRCLRAGGVCMLVTGTTDAPSWMLQGSCYWYCSLPEHVSFYSEKTVRWLADAFGFEVTEYRRLSHIRSSTLWKAKELAKNVAYWGVRRTQGLGVAPLRRLVERRRAPAWITAADHMLCVLRKR